MTATAAGYLYDGKTYRSLTAAAKAITGTHWNGPSFFGVRKTKTKTTTIIGG